MRKTLKYELEYNDCGDFKILPVKITFISNWVSKEYGDIVKEINGVKVKYDRFNAIISDQGTAIYERSVDKLTQEQLQAKMDKLDVEQKEIQEYLEKYNDNVFFQRRVDLIKQIVNDNGNKEPMLQEFDFWNKQVEPVEMMKFLTEAVYKDLDEKDTKGYGKPKK
jgi:hypothetical protein